MKKLLFILFLIWGCDYAPTEHSHSHDHHDLYKGCCVQYHPNYIPYTYIDPENGNEMSFTTSGGQYYFHHKDQIGCVREAAFEEYDEIVWDYIDNQTCDELCNEREGIDCYIDSISILIPNP